MHLLKNGAKYVPWTSLFLILQPLEMILWLLLQQQRVSLVFIQSDLVCTERLLTHWWNSIFYFCFLRLRWAVCIHTIKRLRLMLSTMVFRLQVIKNKRFHFFLSNGDWVTTQKGIKVSKRWFNQSNFDFLKLYLPITIVIF